MCAKFTEHFIRFATTIPAIGPIAKYMISIRAAHFFIVGTSGVFINLAITASLTEFLFGRENYFSGYICGVIANIIYNFIMHTKVTYKTRGNHTMRFAFFVIYTLTLATFQAWLVPQIVAITGVNWYIPVIASVILAFSVITFLFFKVVLFRTWKMNKHI